MVGLEDVLTFCGSRPAQCQSCAKRQRGLSRTLYHVVHAEAVKLWIWGQPSLRGHCAWNPSLRMWLPHGSLVCSTSVERSTSRHDDHDGDSELFFFHVFLPTLQRHWLFAVFVDRFETLLALLLWGANWWAISSRCFEWERWQESCSGCQFFKITVDILRFFGWLCWGMPVLVLRHSYIPVPPEVLRQKLEQRLEEKAQHGAEGWMDSEWTWMKFTGRWNWGFLWISYFLSSRQKVRNTSNLNVFGMCNSLCILCPKAVEEWQGICRLSDMNPGETYARLAQV